MNTIRLTGQKQEGNQFSFSLSVVSHFDKIPFEDDDDDADLVLKMMKRILHALLFEGRLIQETIDSAVQAVTNTNELDDEVSSKDIKYGLRITAQLLAHSVIYFKDDNHKNEPNILDYLTEELALQEELEPLVNIVKSKFKFSEEQTEINLLTVQNYVGQRMILITLVVVYGMKNLFLNLKDMYLQETSALLDELETNEASSEYPYFDAPTKNTAKAMMSILANMVEAFLHKFGNKLAPFPTFVRVHKDGYNLKVTTIMTTK